MREVSSVMVSSLDNIMVVTGDLNAYLAPTDFALSAAYPNPFNPSTSLNFSIPIESKVKISVYDIQGRLVQELLDDLIKPGNYNIQWKASNYSSGIYFINMVSKDFSTTQKITLLK